MSENTELIIETKTTNSNPQAELEFLLYSEHDVWSVQRQKLKYHNDDIYFNVEKNDELFPKLDTEKEFYSQVIFEVILFELSAEESQDILKRIKEKAAYLNIQIEIKLV